VDTFSKFILTVIAVCLIAITVKVWEPKPQQTFPMATLGEYSKIRKLNKDDQKAAYEEISKRLPVIKIIGAVDVSAHSTVEVNNASSIPVVIKQSFKESSLDVNIVRMPIQ